MLTDMRPIFIKKINEVFYMNHIYTKNDNLYDHSLKPIPTEYKGHLFRSRLEARWAVFFDACGVEWEYEPEGFDLGDGIHYLPDFLLHGVVGRAEGDLYVEVKGRMNAYDAEKIKRFAEAGMPENGKSSTAILVVSQIPDGNDALDIEDYISEKAYADNHGFPCPFNFETIDGDYFAAHPGINLDGKFELFGDDSTYLCEMDENATVRAYKLARQARFEYGETPRI